MQQLGRIIADLLARLTGPRPQPAPVPIPTRPRRYR